MSYRLGPTSETAVTIYPEWDYSQGKKKIITEHRSRGGDLYRYTWARYDRFQFALDWVNASDAALINSWWHSDAELCFFIDSGGASEVHSVMIMNDDTPLDQFNKPYDNYYRGSRILLEGY